MDHQDRICGGIREIVQSAEGTGEEVFEAQALCLERVYEDEQASG